VITISTGGDVQGLLARVQNAPEAFSALTVCTPFIGPAEARELASLMIHADHVGCGVHVITTVAGAKVLNSALPRSTLLAKKRVKVRRNLHAKFYVAISRRARSSEAIVTSANLTRGGLRCNRELGIRAKNNSDAGAQLIHKVMQFAQQLAA
jgi:phosphatidylserine/phosphatidylglycerophosphate/cardiolipin synthase-like enzyme